MGQSVEAVRRNYPKWPDRELRIRAEVLGTCDETAIRETHAGFEKEEFFRYWKHLTEPAAPIYGANSPVVADQGRADLVKSNPAIPMVGVVGAGHMVPWDDVDGFFHVHAPSRLKPSVGGKHACGDTTPIVMPCGSDQASLPRWPD